VMQEVIQYLPLDSISAAPQIRRQFDENELIGLAMSMRAIGQQVPIRVRRDGNSFFLVDGARRVRAARKAGIQTVSAIVEGRELSEGEILHRQISINGQRVDVEPSAKANAIERLKTCNNWDATEVGKQLGMSDSKLTLLKALPSLPEAIRELVDQGKVAISTAYNISRVPDPAKQMAMAMEAAAGRLPRDAAAAAVKKSKRGRKSAKRPRKRGFGISLKQGRTVSVSGAESSYESLIAALLEAVELLKAAQADGVALDELQKK
jgi:ParB/RepB/Spo0J family partition protein